MLDECRVLRAHPAPFWAPAQLGEYVRFVHQASQQLAPAAGGAASGAAGGGAAGGAGGSSAAAKGSFITRAAAPALVLASLDADGVAALQPALLPDRLQLLLSALGRAVTDPGAKWAHTEAHDSITRCCAVLWPRVLLPFGACAHSPLTATCCPHV